jgi:HSP20 family protein
MSLPSYEPKSRNGRHLKITHVTSDERVGIVRAAIANRAFQISESRRFEPGHELEDWRRAESEIVRPLNCGFLVSDRNIELNTDSACFGEGEIEIYVEPRRLTICGKEHTCTQEAISESAGHLIIRTFELPTEIDHSEVSARFKGRMIEIKLPRAYTKTKAAAAS